jgi:DNA-binding NarL/FixJ family response regulator
MTARMDAVTRGGNGHAERMAIDELLRQARLVVRLANGLIEAALELRSAMPPVVFVAAVNGTPAPVQLSARQHEVLLLVSEGLSTKAIARRLWLSPATVRNHVSAILRALECHSRLQAVARARRLGLLGQTAGLAAASTEPQA